MTKSLRNQLISIAKKRITKNDPSHDISHALRALDVAEKIEKTEKADLDIVVPAALFHDIVIYSKNDPRSRRASDESAEVAADILKGIKAYPRNKIDKVQTAIRECSFSKGIIPPHKEGKIVQDADFIESTGAIAIMRTFSSTGQMQRVFYHLLDPFARKRNPQPLQFATDLFFSRLLKVEKRVHTRTGKAIVKRRTKFLKQFLRELELELAGK